MTPVLRSSCTTITSIALALSGCQAILGIDDTQPRGTDAVAVDSGTNPATDAGAVPDAGNVVCADWMPVHFDPCAVEPPSAAPMLLSETNYELNTDTGVLTDGQTMVTLTGHVITQDTGAAWLLAVEDFSLPQNSTLRVVGARPLIIGSWSNIAILGVLDVSSRRDAPGVGAMSAPGCAAQIGDDGSYGAGGGGGGGFGGAGGRGGGGNDGNDSGGGGDPMVSAPTTVRAGCPGANGGIGQIGSIPGAGGPSGGAVQLTAHDHIQVDGTIDAGGAGGAGGQLVATGGGGGGSGGYIGFDAATVTVNSNAVMVANGGGGGEGADLNDTGASGRNGLRNANRASGGQGGAGGDGGQGGSIDNSAGDIGVTHNRGGGGGGGGVGHVLSYSSDTMVDPGATVSPAALVRPAP